ncbi:hypothetical protein [Natrinema altunense]|uniref:DUF7978 domain-containing protein n=1 Tax=Natrinema altunense (strain JCM 12890 / CGMCC 1.3731 / AJ2) TaxID=1227494 RepID=L9ZJM0_NATA2|nr:hypothetical protein [Natrinema altunense]ELY85368.1 hypothetical protein C485_12708 [Natrinema altunense JCM 12890]
MSPKPTPSDGKPISRGSSVAASAGLGVFAAAIGYLLTYLLVGSDVREIFGEDVAQWKGVAWYFYEAHMVDVEASGQVGSFSGTRVLDLIAESGADPLYAIPPLVLVAVGAFLAVRWSVTDLGEAVIAGAPVTIGYAAVISLGAIVAESTTEASAFGIETTSSIAPVLVPAIVLGGVMYPLVFATAGAAIGAVVNAQ